MIRHGESSHEPTVLGGWISRRRDWDRIFEIEGRQPIDINSSLNHSRHLDHVSIAITMPPAGPLPTAYVRQ